MSELLAFLGVAVLVIVTPGPDTAITIRGTLIGGRRAGLLTACGVITGQACWTIAASAGVTALLGAIRGTVHDVKVTGTFQACAAYRQGLLSDLGNPKMAAFFTSLLPQRLAAERG